MTGDGEGRMRRVMDGLLTIISPSCTSLCTQHGTFCTERSAHDMCASRPPCARPYAMLSAEHDVHTAFISITRPNIRPPPSLHRMSSRDRRRPCRLRLSRALTLKLPEDMLALLLVVVISVLDSPKAVVWSVDGRGCVDLEPEPFRQQPEDRARARAYSECERALAGWLALSQPASQGLHSLCVRFSLGKIQLGILLESALWAVWRICGASRVASSWVTCDVHVDNPVLLWSAQLRAPVH
jgi:hypothetical protein